MYERRLAYAKALKNAPRGRRSGTKAQAIIDDTARALGDKKPPKLRTVQSYVRVLRASGGDAKFLISLHTVSRRRALRTAQPIVRMMVGCLRQHYLINGEPSLFSAYEAFLADLRKYWDANPALECDTPPAYTTFKRVLERNFDIYRILSYRYGEKEAQRWLRIKEKGIMATRPLELVMTDATPFQVLVVDDKGDLHDRLTLTLVIDVYSRVILGFHLGFEGESWSGYGQALRNAMSPKTYLQTLYPDLAGAWPVEGKFETIISDSTTALMNARFVNALGSLGISHETTKKDSPEHKGIVERAFLTILHELTDLLPGGQRFRKKQWQLRDPEEEACMTLEEVREALTRWIVQIYHHSQHRGLRGKTPMQKWLEGVKKYEFFPPPSEKDLAVCLSHGASAILQHDGVHYENMIYRNPALARLRTKYKQNPEVHFVFDEHSLDKIYVLDEESSQTIEAVSDDIEYARNLSLKEHRRIEAWRRQENKANSLSPMDRAVAKRKFLKHYDDKIKRPKEVKRTLNDIAAKGNRMPYGESADGSLRLAPQEGFDDLAGTSATPNQHRADPLPSATPEQAPAEDSAGDVSTAASGQAEHPRDPDDAGRSNNDDTEDLDRLLGEMGWGESDS